MNRSTVRKIINNPDKYLLMYKMLEPDNFYNDLTEHFYHIYVHDIIENNKMDEYNKLHDFFNNNIKYFNAKKLIANITYYYRYNIKNLEIFKNYLKDYKKDFTEHLNSYIFNSDTIFYELDKLELIDYNVLIKYAENKYNEGEQILLSFREKLDMYQDKLKNGGD